jgi:hypothetical protein
MNLQMRLEEGGFYYIQSFKHDAANRSLTVGFTKAPEEKALATRLLMFEDVDVHNWSEVSACKEAADGIIDSLIGLTEYLHEGKKAYELLTENYELNLCTTSEPRIIDLQCVETPTSSAKSCT